MEFPIKKPPFSSGVFQPATFEDPGRVVGQAMLANIPFTGETTSFQLSFLGISRISRFFFPAYLIVHYIPLIFQGFSHMFPLFLGMFPYFPIDMLLFSILFPYFPIDMLLFSILFPYFPIFSNMFPIFQGDFHCQAMAHRGGQSAAPIRWEWWPSKGATGPVFERMAIHVLGDLLSTSNIYNIQNIYK